MTINEREAILTYLEFLLISLVEEVEPLAPSSAVVGKLYTGTYALLEELNDATTEYIETTSS